MIVICRRCTAFCPGSNKLIRDERLSYLSAVAFLFCDSDFKVRPPIKVHFKSYNNRNT